MTNHHIVKICDKGRNNIPTSISALKYFGERASIYMMAKVTLAYDNVRH